MNWNEYDPKTEKKNTRNKNCYLKESKTILISQHDIQKLIKIIYSITLKNGSCSTILMFILVNRKISLSWSRKQLTVWFAVLCSKTTMSLIFITVLSEHFFIHIFYNITYLLYQQNNIIWWDAWNSWQHHHSGISIYLFFGMFKH